MTKAKLRQHVNTALVKALQAGLAETVRRVEHGRYLVPSTSDAKVTYVVTGRSKVLGCTCQAGEHLPYCQHRAAVAICRLREEGYDLELGPDGVLQAVRRERADDLVLPAMEYPQWVGE
jgi:hypothetical protein